MFLSSVYTRIAVTSSFRESIMKKIREILNHEINSYSNKYKAKQTVPSFIFRALIVLHCKNNTILHQTWWHMDY